MCVRILCHSLLLLVFSYFMFWQIFFLSSSFSDFVVIVVVAAVALLFILRTLSRLFHKIGLCSARTEIKTQINMNIYDYFKKFRYFKSIEILVFVLKLFYFFLRVECECSLSSIHSLGLLTVCVMSTNEATDLTYCWYFFFRCTFRYRRLNELSE